MREAPPQPLVCVECGRADRDGRGRGWRAYVVPGDNPNTEEVVFFCPDCTRREFEESRRDDRAVDCVDCDASVVDYREGTRAGWRVDVRDGELVHLCPECARRAFGHGHAS